jgi:deoxyribodipyrimidine photo-lyase
MQSGTTGINTIRMYNPVKQARDQDPGGAFVRQWIPALARVPDAFVFEPWTMPATVQQAAHCVVGRDYPAPIVDNAESMRAARERVWSLKARREVRETAQAVYEKHGSRHPGREGTPRRSRAKPASAPQMAFPFEDPST